MTPVITGPMARALEAERARYNALFAQARRHAPALDAEAFAVYLRSVVGPIVEAVARVQPKAVQEVVEVLYEFALELVGKNLPARYPAITEGWRVLLGGLPEPLASAPRVFAGSVTNALYNLSLTSEARPQGWIEAMREIGPLCSDANAFLEVGKVAAWRAGLAHFREGALETCRALPPDLARKALGLPEAAAELSLETVLQRLQENPWLNPALLGEAEAETKRLRIVARIGAFRGFGGLFLRPPQVACVEGRFLLSDGNGCWTLDADLFGASLHRADSAFPAPNVAPLATFRLEPDGRVLSPSYSQVFRELQGWTSAASDGTTLAVTLPLSHAVTLIALA